MAKSSRVNFLGSFTRNVKRVSMAALLLVASSSPFVAAEESNYKIRIHKNLMQNIIDKNLPVALEHIEARATKDVLLPDSGARIDNIKLRIEPIEDSSWDKIRSDLFFDQGQIVTEISGLHFVGSGQITDPDTGMQDTISLKVPLDLAQLVLSPDQELSKEGFVYPKIEITEVVFQLDQKQFDIKLEGELPVYKTHRFEESIKKWMISSLKERETDFKLQMQFSEREIMQTFAFKKEINSNAAAHSTLSETMNLEDDHVVISYRTEFEGVDLEPVKGKMRKVDPAFSNEPAFMKDVQMLVDENYLNYLLFNMFETEKEFSLTESLFSMWPEDWMGGPTVIRGLMSVSIWQALFRDLGRKYGPA